MPWKWEDPGQCSRWIWLNKAVLNLFQVESLYFKLFYFPLKMISVLHSDFCFLSTSTIVGFMCLISPICVWLYSKYVCSEIRTVHIYILSTIPCPLDSSLSPLQIFHLWNSIIILFFKNEHFLHVTLEVWRMKDIKMADRLPFINLLNKQGDFPENDWYKQFEWYLFLCDFGYFCIQVHFYSESLTAFLIFIHDWNIIQFFNY